jgi:hypothetical protein
MKFVFYKLLYKIGYYMRKKIQIPATYDREL